MFKIGDFSKLSQVMVKTLRYYDDIGLLKPISVDRFTGYRYYSVDQLPRLHRILALKEIEANGYHIVGPNREIYLKGPGDAGGPDTYVTEIQVPVAR